MCYGVAGGNNMNVRSIISGNIGIFNIVWYADTDLNLWYRFHSDLQRFWFVVGWKRFDGSTRISISCVRRLMWHIFICISFCGFRCGLACCHVIASACHKHHRMSFVSLSKLTERLRFNAICSAHSCTVDRTAASCLFMWIHHFIIVFEASMRWRRCRGMAWECLKSLKFVA